MNELPLTYSFNINPDHLNLMLIKKIILNPPPLLLPFILNLPQSKGPPALTFKYLVYKPAGLIPWSKLHQIYLLSAAEVITALLKTWETLDQYECPFDHLILNLDYVFGEVCANKLFFHFIFAPEKSLLPNQDGEPKNFWLQVWQFLNLEGPAFSTFFSHLETKDFQRCLAAAIPATKRPIFPFLPRQLLQNLTTELKKIIWTLRTSSFFSGQAETEDTEIVAIKNPALQLAYLSEGLPGTLSEQKGLRVFILTDVFIIGRQSQQVDFKILDANISKIHASINRFGNNYFIRDHNSKNGTFLNEQRLERQKDYLLPKRCRISFAQKNFFFQIED